MYLYTYLDITWAFSWKFIDIGVLQMCIFWNQVLQPGNHNYSAYYGSTELSRPIVQVKLHHSCFYEGQGWLNSVQYKGQPIQTMLS